MLGFILALCVTLFGMFCGVGFIHTGEFGLSGLAFMVGMAGCGFAVRKGAKL